MGLGDDDAAHNPFAARDPLASDLPALPALTALAAGPWLAGLPERTAPGHVVRRLDPHLGDPGLPQSATGQTTLLTGRDAVSVMGRPYGPWPGPTLLRLLEEGNLFHDGAALQGGAALANAYPQGFLDAVSQQRGRHRRLRPSTAMAAAGAAGVRLRNFDEMRAGQAVGVDLDGEPARLVEPAAHLAALAKEHAFTYLDLWRTDEAGHGADLATGRRVVERLDAFMEALLPGLDRVTLVLTSDHGNLEDLSHGSHTHAEVPLIALGAGAGAFAEVRDLQGVAPAVRSLLTDGTGV